MLIILLLLAIVFIVVSTTRWKLHPFLALLLTALGFGLAAGMPVEVLLKSINEGFGGTLGSIGLVIVLGVIMGAFLEHSGGAYALAERLLRFIGKNRVPTGMALIGYIVSIPVFADSGFILLQPLNKALTKRAGKSLACTAVALAMGLLASHCMVPPTPGPIATAGILGADLGLVIFIGAGVSLVALVPCIVFARMVAAKTWIDPNPELAEADLAKKTAEAPGAFKSFLPILVPILLIVAKSFNEYGDYVREGWLHDGLAFLGTPVIALLIGLGLALLLPKKLEKKMLSTEGWVGQSLKSAAVIIMVTGAGGIFGKVLQNSGLADVIGENLGHANLGIWLPFLIAAALKTAQGSSTVAMITTASIIAPLMGTLGLEADLAKALAVVAIGAGSAMVSHANDSFFWVVTQMSGMDVSQGYRLHTAATAVLGISAAIAIFIIWSVFV
jgi:gluconate:H+ symporter, GntP family